MTSELRLNEIELLLLQQEMEGDVSGLGYELQVAGVETADFSGDREENIHEARPVRTADDLGQIRKIKFYVEYSGENDPERSVMLSIFDDGHVTTSKPVRAELLNAITDQVHTTKQYEEFLTPLNELLNLTSSQKFEGGTTMMEDEYRRKTNSDFDDLIDHYFNVSTPENRLYKSIIANIGIRLCEDGVDSTDDHDEVEQLETGIPDRQGKIEDFYKSYAKIQYGLAEIDYESLEGHLNYLLEKDWEKPVDIIEHASTKYDL